MIPKKWIWSNAIDNLLKVDMGKATFALPTFDEIPELTQMKQPF